MHNALAHERNENLKHRVLEILYVSKVFLHTCSGFHRAIIFRVAGIG